MTLILKENLNIIANNKKISNFEISKKRLEIALLYGKI